MLFPFAQCQQAHGQEDFRLFSHLALSILPRTNKRNHRYRGSPGIPLCPIPKAPAEATPSFMPTHKTRTHVLLTMQEHRICKLLSTLILPYQSGFLEREIRLNFSTSSHVRLKKRSPQMGLKSLMDFLNNSKVLHC